MRNKENQNRKKTKRIQVGQIILLIIAGAALVSVAAVAPGVIYALKKLGVDKKLLNRQKYYINDSFDRLAKRGLIEIITKNGKQQVKLTKEGRRELFKFQSKGLMGQIPKKWDNKYRVVIFDIKENEKFIREEIRYTLLQCGFVKLQNSVWIYPYPCEGMVHIMRTHLEIGESKLVYMTVESVENDAWIRKHFHLS